MTLTKATADKLKVDGLSSLLTLDEAKRRMSWLPGQLHKLRVS